MTRNNLDNNKCNIDADMAPLRLPIEEPIVLAIPTQDNNNLVLCSPDRDTSTFTPSSPPVTESGPLVNPPSKVKISIIGIKPIKYSKCHCRLVD